MTSSLPRKRSTPELHWLLNWSGRRGSNPRPSAWKADALPTELLPHTFRYKNSGESRIRTYEGVRQQIYSLPQLATLVSPHYLYPFKKLGADGGIRTPDQLITNQLLWPTELHRQYVNFPFSVKPQVVFLSFGIAKICDLFLSTKLFCKKFSFFSKNFLRYICAIMLS